MTLTWQTLLGGDLAPILTILLCAALAAGLVRWGGRSNAPTPIERTASPKSARGGEQTPGADPVVQMQPETTEAAETTKATDAD